GEAVQRPTMRFVPLKTMEQLDLQAIHRIRTRLVARRTAVINQMRGFLLERGVTFPIGREALVKRFPEVLDNPALGLSVRFCRLLQQLRDEWRLLDDDIEDVDQDILSLARADEACDRLMQVPGIGPLTATALVAAVGNGAAFAKGRDLAAWLGLVPRQHSTGGKTTLGRISKRGNAYLGCLFIHGARSVRRLIARSRSVWGGGSRILRPGLIRMSWSSRSRTNWYERPGPCFSETTTTTGGCWRMRDA
ncbi:MAG: IS110 family transposase, partial [Thermoanaerobaculia bacterium]